MLKKSSIETTRENFRVFMESLENTLEQIATAVGENKLLFSPTQEQLELCQTKVLNDYDYGDPYYLEAQGVFIENGEIMVILHDEAEQHTLEIPISSFRIEDKLKIVEFCLETMKKGIR